MCASCSPRCAARLQLPHGALLARFADGVAASGATVLCCQRRLAPALIRMLLARGVTPLPRISLRHIEAVRRLSGAVVLSHLEPPPASALGHVGAVHALPLGARSFVHLLPSASADGARPAGASYGRPVTTLVLCAPNRTASEELASAVACAL